MWWAERGLVRTRFPIIVMVAALLLATVTPAIAAEPRSSPTLASPGSRVSVSHAQTLIHDVIDEVDDLDLPRLERKLTKKLRKALKALEWGNTRKAVRRLNRFINQVEARAGWKIPTADARDLIAAAQHIIDVLAPSWDQVPVVTNPGGQSSALGTVVSLQVVGSDPDGGPVFWSATGLPPGLGINPIEGRISGTITSSVGSPFWVTVTATDNDTPQRSANASFIWTITSTPGWSMFEVRVRASGDDVEEQSDGWLYTDSSDLELMQDGDATQKVGLRFTGVIVPRNAVIVDAWIQFTVDEWSVGSVALRIRANEVGNAAGFSGSYDVSTRDATTTSVMWYPSDWTTVGQTGVQQRTPSLAALVQAIVDRTDWTPGNAMAFLIDGSGWRTAESYDGQPDAAPQLHIEYWTPGGKVFCLIEADDSNLARIAHLESHGLTAEEMNPVSEHTCHQPETRWHGPHSPQRKGSTR